MQTEQIRRCQTLKKLEGHVLAMRSPHNVFNQLLFQKTIVWFRNDISLRRKRLPFYQYFYNYPLIEGGLGS